MPSLLAYTTARDNNHELTVLLWVLTANDQTSDRSGDNVRDASGAGVRRFHHHASWWKAGGRMVGTKFAPGTVADDLQKLLDVACIVALKVVDVSPVAESHLCDAYDVDRMTATQINIAHSDERLLRVVGYVAIHGNGMNAACLLRVLKRIMHFEFGGKENRLLSHPKRELLPNKVQTGTNLNPGINSRFGRTCGMKKLNYLICGNGYPGITIEAKA
ncbi:hypothetical protein EDD22DRAFT_843806 [Suillus occidentalis]|nr:hypothetical protein EDD22DRAFT_843806 [Suillus occidentalis]